MNPERDKHVKQLYTMSYTLNQQEADLLVEAMQELKTALIEELLEQQDFTEANQVIANIKGKL
jgi:hypothetical protein